MKTNFIALVFLFTVLICKGEGTENFPLKDFSDRANYGTVRIASTLKDGKKVTGTGFFFMFVLNGKTFVPTIITNKHVIDGSVTGRFDLNLATTEGSPNGNFIPVKYDNFKEQWLLHPDKKVDLAILPIGPLLRQLNKEGKKVFSYYFDRKILLTKEELKSLPTVTDILMVGYPNGIMDKKNNRPVFRKGITATHPNVDYNGEECFLIDAAVFPGSSGSPVFIFNNGIDTHTP